MTATKVHQQAPAQRQRLIKLIHVGRRELNMDEATYRQVLMIAGKADSASAMTVPALTAVLEHMKSCGFKIKTKTGAAPRRPLLVAPDASKVRALWLFLFHLGAVRDPSEDALATYVKRIAGVDDLRWVRGDGVTLLIETLKKWAMRHLPAAVSRLQAEAIAAHQSGALTPRQHETFQAATTYLQRGHGFDKHWQAWEALQVGLGRSLPLEIKGLGEGQSHD